MTRPIGTRPLVMYLEGEVTPSEAAALEARIEDTRAVRDELESVRSIMDGIRSHEDFSRVDLAPAVRAAIASTPRRPSQGVGYRRVVIAASAAVALAAGVLLWFTVRRSEPTRDDEFRAKGAPIGTAPDRWIGLGVYQTGADGAFHVAEHTVKAGRPLAFTYTNLGPTPFRYLMVLGIDSGGEQFWFYPAVDGDATAGNVTAIPIQPGGSVQLPDLVEHDLGVGPMVIYGVFANQPLTAADVATALTAQRPLAGASLHRIELEVVR